MVSLSAMSGAPTILFKRKVELAHGAYVKNGGTLSLKEFTQLAWALHKVESAYFLPGK
jgi:hypothetical protein